MPSHQRMAVQGRASATSITVRVAMHRLVDKRSPELSAPFGPVLHTNRALAPRPHGCVGDGAVDGMARGANNLSTIRPARLYAVGDLIDRRR